MPDDENNFLEKKKHPWEKESFAQKISSGSYKEYQKFIDKVDESHERNPIEGHVTGQKVITGPKRSKDKGAIIRNSKARNEFFLDQRRQEKENLSLEDRVKLRNQHPQSTKQEKEAILKQKKQTHKIPLSQKLYNFIYEFFSPYKRQINTYAKEMRVKEWIGDKSTVYIRDYITREFSFKENHKPRGNFVNNVRKIEPNTSHEWNHLTYINTYASLLLKDEHIFNLAGYPALKPYIALIHQIGRLFNIRNEMEDQILFNHFQKKLDLTDHKFSILLDNYYKPLINLTLHYSPEKILQETNKGLRILQYIYKATENYTDQRIFEADHIKYISDQILMTVDRIFKEFDPLMYGILLKNKDPKTYHAPSERESKKLKEYLLQIKKSNPNAFNRKFPQSDEVKKTLEMYLSKLEKEKQIQEGILEEGRLLEYDEAQGYAVFKKWYGNNFNELRLKYKDYALTKEFQLVNERSMMQRTYLFFKAYLFEFSQLFSNTNEQIIYRRENTDAVILKDAMNRSQKILHEIDIKFENFFKRDIESYSKLLRPTGVQETKLRRQWRTIQKELKSVIDKTYSSTAEIHLDLQQNKNTDITDLFVNVEAPFIFQRFEHDKTLKKINEYSIRKSFEYLHAATAFIHYALSDGFLVGQDKVIYMQQSSEAQKTLSEYDLPDLKGLLPHERKS